MRFTCNISISGIDTRMRFTVEPLPGDSAFEQWKDAMKAVARLPLGIPDEFRKKVIEILKQVNQTR